jgi:hypothetical protein
MTLLAQTDLPTLVALGLLGVVVGVMLLRVQRYYRQHPSPGPSLGASSRPGHAPRPDASPPAHQHGVAREMLEWEVQVHEMVREMSGQLNSKMAALEQLIREADRAAARLETALVAARGVGPPASAPTLPPGEQEGDAPRPTSQADALKPVVADDQVSDAGAADEQRPAERPSRQRRHEEIYTLADYGYDAAEIARRVGTPVGEIELILGLRENR